MAGALSPGAMRRLYGVFLLAVAMYFLVSPEGIKKDTRAPAAPATVDTVPDDHP
jgi:hypothetical protein